MYPITYLEWLHKGLWQRIGWTATSPRSAADLREHGYKLAAVGGQYRLVQPSHLAGEPPVVIHTFLTHQAAS